ncbi:thiocillin family RiPP [Kitasatospora sp. NPDC002227]|uniref:thiocillin family RiPP n=1 Tax=Kitasatospora sp. NPDC002227 TaxID=3154773 RepID=UPI00331BFADF
MQHLQDEDFQLFLTDDALVEELGETAAAGSFGSVGSFGSSVGSCASSVSTGSTFS